MDIIFQGQHSGEEIAASLLNILCLFKERYRIEKFQEIQLSVTLLDNASKEVELIDSETEQAYKTFEVYRKAYEFRGQKGYPVLKLVVDNTK